MMWVLGNEKDLKNAGVLMQKNLVGECNRRSAHGL
jgi:hypothetical protein